MQGKRAKIVSPTQERAILGYLETTRYPRRGGVPNELISDSDGSPICIAIDEEANHKIMHLDGFRKTDGLPY